MDTLKITGYGVSILGLATVVLSKTIAAFPVIKSLAKPELYVIIGGFVLVAAGVALSLSGSSSSNKIKQAEEEVPIYEGEGKKRKIVGYRKASK
jgi:hypothetical protein